MSSCRCDYRIFYDENARLEQMVNIDLPIWSKERIRRIKNSMSPSVCIDPCIVDHIKFLWENGIDTLGSCCGHGILDASVYVYEEDTSKMIELGYEPMNEGEHPNIIGGFILFKNKGLIMSISSIWHKAAIELADKIHNKENIMSDVTNPAFCGGFIQGAKFEFEREKWIKVSDQYPGENININVLVSYEHGVTECKYLWGVFVKNGSEVPGVTHWQPLPEKAEK